MSEGAISIVSDGICISDSNIIIIPDYHISNNGGPHPHITHTEIVALALLCQVHVGSHPSVPITVRKMVSTSAPKV
jgi:hypothetical protein